MSVPGPDLADGAGPAAGGRRGFGQVLKDIGLFFAAPFVTLAYVALFPFLGFAALRRTMRERKKSS
jgi:hypothetical protein